MEELLGSAFIGSGFTIIFLSLAICESHSEQNMALKFQGLASKLAMLKHNLEMDAEAVSTGIDAADAKRLVVMPKAQAVISSAHKDLADVESFIADVESATNGPPDDDHKTSDALKPLTTFP